MKFIIGLVTYLFCFGIYAESSNTYKVGVLYWSMNIEGQVAMRKGLEERASKLNESAKKAGKKSIELIPYVAGDGTKGIETQIKQMKELIKKNPDIIIVQPTDNAALAEPLILANKANIPVIAYDQYIDGGELTSYVTSNNYQAGFLGGEYIASKFKKSQEIKIVLVEYPHVSSTVERVDGFLDALSEAKQKFKVLGNFTAVEPVSGKKAGKDILKKFPKKNSVDVIFTVNDGGGLSVVEELRKAGRTEIKIATIDGDPKSLKNIKKSNLTVIDSAQFCGELGRQSMQVAYDKLVGKSVPKKVLVPTFPITKETMKLYPGWLGQMPKAFKKPWNQKMWDNSFK